MSVFIEQQAGVVLEDPKQMVVDVPASGQRAVAVVRCYFFE
jgi:hypothetical protein